MNAGVETEMVGCLVMSLALPQLVGFLLTRFARRPTGVTWAAAAIAVWSAIWYGFMWVPADRAAQQSHCGTGELAVLFLLLAGLLVHLVTGVLLALLVRRVSARRHRPVTPTNRESR